MNEVSITYVGKDYDYLAPLACGDVAAEGIALRLDRVADTMAGGGAQVRFLSNPAVEAGEYSFSLYLIGLSRGERDFVGIPFFAYRGFRHRCIYVRRDSGLRSGKDLEGKRVGLNAWKTTGNTWTRAALREEGVSLDRIEWMIGPMDDSGRDAAHHKPQPDLPTHVRPTPPGRTLESMLLSGDLDAMMSPAPPRSYSGAGGPTVRLYPDYRRVEKDYYARTGIYPAHHIVVLRRDTFERYPWVARSLFAALERSKLRWQERRRGLAETTPWMEEEIEEAIRVFGGDWQPNGVEANGNLIKTLCEEEHAQGLLKGRIDPAEVFAEFERAATA
jgi:4,5-dihydroxyphthalate decarboxylase